MAPLGEVSRPQLFDFVVPLWVTVFFFSFRSWGARGSDVLKNIFAWSGALLLQCLVAGISWLCVLVHAHTARTVPAFYIYFVAFSIQYNYTLSRFRLVSSFPFSLLVSNRSASNTSYHERKLSLRAHDGWCCIVASRTARLRHVSKHNFWSRNIIMGNGNFLSLLFFPDIDSSY